MTYQRTSLEFARYADADFDSFAAGVLSGLTNNTAFPNLPVTLTVLTGLYTDFHTAFIAAAAGGRELIARRNLARVLLENALRQEAAYVEAVAGEDVALLLTSGFKPVSTSRTQSPLSTPVVLNVDNQLSSQLMIDLKAIPNARTYQVKVTTPQGAVLPTVESTRSRKIVVPDLTPGTVYTFQARAIGGSTGYSGWSDPTSKMAT